MTNPLAMGTDAGGASAPSVTSSPMTFAEGEYNFNSQLASLEAIFNELDRIGDKLILDNDDPILTDETILKYSPESLDLVCSFEGIGDWVRKFLEGTAKTLNVIGMSISKLLMTGFPLFKGIIQKAQQIKENLKVAEVKTGTIDFKGIAKLPLGGHAITPLEAVHQIDLLTSITADVLTKEKLDRAMEISRDTLEPFRGNVKRNKTDEVVFLFGVLAALSNPAVPVGMVVKQIFSAVSPGAGKALDAASVVQGGITKGVLTAMEATLPTMGSAGTAMLRDFQNGRVDLSVLPTYRSMYAFCTNKENNKNPFTEVYSSPLLVGNMKWYVSDYVKVLEGSFQGRIGKVGARFESAGPNKAPGVAEALNLEQIIALCDGIIDIFTMASSYAKSFPHYYRGYNKLYNEISNIVMGHEGNQLRDTYVRYSYRNAMNLMLGSMWNNTFGSDNRFIRYLISISKKLLRYCEESIAAPTQEQPEID